MGEFRVSREMRPKVELMSVVAMDDFVRTAKRLANTGEMRLMVYVQTPIGAPIECWRAAIQASPKLYAWP